MLPPAEDETAPTGRRAASWLRERLELARGGSAGNVRPMEGLRGFAVLLVFWVHYSTLLEPWVPADSLTHSISGALYTMGNTGVDLFFVLSGYLIYGSLLSRAQPFRAFMARRIERIYPAFLAVFVIYVLLSWARPEVSKIPAGAGAAALYLAENVLLLPGLAPVQPLITVAWSLSYEMFFYVTIPIVIGVLRLRARSAAWRTALFTLLALAGLACGASLGGHVRLVMFVAGILLHETIEARWLRVPPSAVACAALAIGLGSRLVALEGTWGKAIKLVVLFLAFFLLCQTCFCNPAGWLGRCFSWTPMRWLGNMSYSYYLLHALALKGAVFLLATVHPPSVSCGAAEFWVLLLPLFALSVSASMVLFLAVERPLSLSSPRRSGDRRLSRPR